MSNIIKSDSVVKISGDSYCVDDIRITKNLENSQYKEVLAWIADGNTPAPEFTDTEKLNTCRAVAESAIRIEAISRISAILPDLNNFNSLEVIKVIFSFLSSPGADLTLVRDIYVYAKNKIDECNAADQVTVEAYDPSTDTGWPT